MLVQVIDIFDHTTVHGAGNGNIIDHGKMLHIFTKANAAGMWPDWLVVFRSNQQHGQHFIQATHTAAVDLNNVDSAFRDELLEHDTVLAHFAGRNLHIANRLQDHGQPSS